MVSPYREGGETVKIQAKRLEDGEHITMNGIKKIQRLRADLNGTAKKEGWLLEDNDGLSLIYDEVLHIVSIEDD